MTLSGAVPEPREVGVPDELQQLAASDGELARVLSGVFGVIAEESIQNSIFIARQSVVLMESAQREAVLADTAVAPVPPVAKTASTKVRHRRGRRAPGPWDPHRVHAEFGEQGLRERLAQLELEQLRDIVAEHGMNNDGKALRWKTADLVIGRIVERVAAKSIKGDAFRSA